MCYAFGLHLHTAQIENIAAVPSALIIELVRQIIAFTPKIKEHDCIKMSGHKTEKELRTKAAKYLQSKSSEVKCFNERTEQSVPRFAPRGE